MGRLTDSQSLKQVNGKALRKALREDISLIGAKNYSVISHELLIKINKKQDLYVHTTFLTPIPASSLLRSQWSNFVLWA